MGAGETILTVGIIGTAAAGLFFFRDNIKNAFASPEQKAADAKQTEATADLIDGIGKTGGKIVDSILNVTKGSNKGAGKVAATDKQKMILGFDDNALVLIDNETGVIEANTSPKFTLTEAEKTAIRAAKNDRNRKKVTGRRFS